MTPTMTHCEKRDTRASTPDEVVTYASQSFKLDSNELLPGKIIMTILRVGTNEKYADGWNTAFGKGKKNTAKKKTTKKKATKKKSATKVSATKSKAKSKKKAKTVTAARSSKKQSTKKQSAKKKPAKKKAGKK